MKAQELVQLVYKAEQELKVEIGDIVQKKISALSVDTGFDMGGIEITLLELTNLASEYREWDVQYVSIKYSLPDKIFMG